MARIAELDALGISNLYDYTEGVKAGELKATKEILGLLEEWLNDDNADFIETLDKIKEKLNGQIQ